MSSILNGEEVLCSVNSYKDIKNSSKVVNFFANFLGRGVAGGVINDFKLLLTPENLYIQAIEHAAWGGLAEVAYTDKFSREDIKAFEVKEAESKEFITITIKDDNKITLIRDNDNKSDLALMMAMLIKESKAIRN